MDLTALTFNVRYDTAKDGSDAWEFRRELVLDLVRDQGAHVVGFQEAMPRQRAELQAGLPQYTFLGHGRDADEGGEQCCLAIDPSFTIEDSGTFWLAPTPDNPGTVGWDAELTRICTWARLNKADTIFTVYNAHWDHRGPKARVETARLLFSKVMSGPYPVLLMGDFNTTPHSEPLELLTATLQDSFDVAHPGSTLPTFHGFGKIPHGERIDYLLASPEFLVVDCHIIEQSKGPYPSDHYPVFARYELLP